MVLYFEGRGAGRMGGGERDFVRGPRMRKDFGVDVSIDVGDKKVPL